MNQSRKQRNGVEVMSFLANIFKAIPKPKGISMGIVEAWEVSGINHLPDFLRALPNLLPDNSILYLEGTSAKEVITFLQKNSASETTQVAVGTIWPRPQFFHIPVSSEIMNDLAQISEKYAQPEICIHLHAYKDDHVLLEWHDAFFQEFIVSKEISEEKVTKFSAQLGGTYKEAVYSR